MKNVRHNLEGNVLIENSYKSFAMRYYWFNIHEATIVLPLILSSEGYIIYCHPESKKKTFSQTAGRSRRRGFQLLQTRLGQGNLRVVEWGVFQE